MGNPLGAHDMNRRLAFVLVSLWAIVVAICVWEWHILGRCPEWTHDHHTGPGLGWILAAALLVSWGAIWLGGRR